MQTNILQRNYSASQINYQFRLPLELWEEVPENDPVRLVSAIIERMDMDPLYETYRSSRKMKYPPGILLKILLYGYMEGNYSSRSLELACRRDVNFRFLLEGRKAPDYTTIARFRTAHFAQCAEFYHAELIRMLHDLGEIDGIHLFIDGTKIESRANRYTFVWKRATVTNQKKLQAKMAALAEECEKTYGLSIVPNGQVTVEIFTEILEELHRLKEEMHLEFVYGSGHRKSELQKHIEKMTEYKIRHDDYEARLECCGKRNSFSKTDPDATFMRMKEDAMRNGQLKPAYNIQYGVDSEYVVGIQTGPSPVDTPTLIPFMQALEESLPFRYTKVTADGGYESEENYEWLHNHHYEAFIKPTNYEISKTRKYRNDIGRAENMEYDPEEDIWFCAQGHPLTLSGIRTARTATGYSRQTRIYHCDSCEGCPCKAQCIKGHSKVPLEERSKNLYVAPQFAQYRREATERITSDEGCLLRMNRSIQAEGSFGQLKANMNFRRFLCFGKVSVTAEITLLAIAHNIRKLHRKIQDKRTGTHLFPLKEAS